MVPNLGSMLIILATFLAVYVTHMLLLIVSVLIKSLRGARDKFGRWLYWTGSIRFIMEIYLDYMLFAVLNLKEITWQYDILGVKICNYFSIAVVSLGTLLPLIIIIKLLCNCRANLAESRFKRTMGAIIEDKDIKEKGKNNAVISLSVLFFMSRLQLVLVLVYF